MPYRRRKRRHRHSAKGNPNKRLKNRVKRRVPLLTRATLSNYRIIKKLNKSIETKLIEQVQGVSSTSGYLGQWAHINASSHGLDNSAHPSCIRPMYGIAQGAASNQRTGNQIVMKSLTYKISCVPSGGQPQPVAGTYIDVGAIVFLDRNPQVACNLNGRNSTTVPPVWGADTNTMYVSPLKDSGNTPAFGEYPQHMYFQSMDTCAGPDARYKILKHHRGRIWNKPGTTDSSSKNAEWKVSNTLKNHYKINYEDTQTSGSIEDPPAFESVYPSNQEIKIFFYSSCGVINKPVNPNPTFTVACRFRYKDA